MYLTSGAKVRTRRSRSARSFVARYCFQRARASPDVARRDVGVGVMLDFLFEGGRGGRVGYRPRADTPTSPLLISALSVIRRARASPQPGIKALPERPI